MTTGCWVGVLNGDPAVQAVFLKMRDELDVQTVFETGTCVGHTTAWLAKNFHEVFAIEKQADYLEQTEARCKGAAAKTHFVHGDSSVALGESIDRWGPPPLPHVALFYLDAHWGEHWPLRQEMEAISTRMAGRPFVVVVDDVITPTRGLAGNYTIEEVRAVVDPAMPAGSRTFLLGHSDLPAQSGTGRYFAFSPPLAARVDRFASPDVEEGGLWFTDRAHFQDQSLLRTVGTAAPHDNEAAEPVLQPSMVQHTGMDLLIVSHHKCGATLSHHIGNAIAQALNVQCAHYTEGVIGVISEVAKFTSDPRAPSTVQTDWHAGFSAASHAGWSAGAPPRLARGVRVPDVGQIPYLAAAQRAREAGRDVRILHLCRHPKEVVCSSRRYHRNCSEVWCNESGYARILNEKTAKEADDFEMHNVAGTVIAEMLAWLTVTDVPWVTHVTMDVAERWDEAACARIAAATNVSRDDLWAAFQKSRSTVLTSKASHGRRKAGETSTFLSEFDDELHKEFELLFPDWERLWRHAQQQCSQ